jgi:DNA-binding CsgD family transcriptional regulator
MSSLDTPRVHSSNQPNTPSPRRLEEWTRALDAFGIAYCCLPEHRDHWLSPGAVRALGDGWINESVVAQVARLGQRAMTEVSVLAWRGHPELVTRVPAATASATLSVYALKHADGTRLVVVLMQQQSITSRAMLTDCGLTPREVEVAELIAKGRATKEIAGRLAISQHTARHHTERIFHKLGLQTRAAVAATVAAQGNLSHFLPAAVPR